MTRTPAPALTAVLDELDELRAKATPGPWAQHPSDDEYVIGDVSDDGMSYADVGDTYAFRKREGSYDAALIVAAVNRLPQLVEALRAVLDLADDWDRNAAIFPEYGDLSAAAARSIRTAITTAMEAS